MSIFHKLLNFLSGSNTSNGADITSPEPSSRYINRPSPEMPAVAGRECISFEEMVSEHMYTPDDQPLYA